MTPHGWSVSVMVLEQFGYDIPRTTQTQWYQIVQTLFHSLVQM